MPARQTSKTPARALFFLLWGAARRRPGCAAGKWPIKSPRRRPLAFGWHRRENRCPDECDWKRKNGRRDTPQRNLAANARRLWATGHRNVRIPARFFHPSAASLAGCACKQRLSAVPACCRPAKSGAITGPVIALPRFIEICPELPGVPGLHVPRRASGPIPPGRPIREAH